MKILLVDDSKPMRALLRQALSACEDLTTFAEAADGAAAIELLATTPGAFDLVVIDANMPGMDGLTLARRIRETDRRTPLLLTLTEAQRPRAAEGLKIGVNACVLKPFNPDELLEKVKQTLEQAPRPHAAA